MEIFSISGRFLRNVYNTDTVYKEFLGSFHMFQGDFEFS